MFWKGDLRARIKQKKIVGDIEAKLVQLCCSEPPEGFAKWSLRLLADRMVELKNIDYISHVTVGDVTKESVEEFVKESIDSKAVLFTDKNTAYVNLEKMVEEHIKVKSTSESTNGVLNWVHTAISNLKKNLLGIYHMVSEKYLQNYLDEFAYKLNRGYFGEKLFERLIIASVYPYVHSE